MEIPELNHAIELYLAGMTAKKAAAEIGISDSCFRDRLSERGIVIRDKNSYPRNMEPCWAASRARAGIPEPEERRLRRARTREHRGRGVSQYEERLAALLAERGILTQAQMAIGPYNVDLALEEPGIAVEVDGGGHNPRVKANRPKRLKYLLDSGWHVVEVSVGRPRPSTGAEWGCAGAADYIVAFAEAMSGNPTATRQHRMIRRDGKPRSSRRPYQD